MMYKIKRQQAGVMSLVVFAVLVAVGIIVFNSISTSSTTTLASATTATRMIAGNMTANTYSGFQLVSVGPIIFGAVIILGIVGALYLRR